MTFFFSVAHANLFLVESGEGIERSTTPPGSAARQKPSWNPVKELKVAALSCHFFVPALCVESGEGIERSRVCRHIFLYLNILWNPVKELKVDDQVCVHIFC